MTLQRFLTGMADSRACWLPGLRRFRPPADLRWTAAASCALALTALAWSAVGGLVLKVLFTPTPMAASWWSMEFALGLGLAVALLGTGLLAVAWNRRAAVLRAAGRTSPVPPPPRRWWQTFVVGPFYFLLLLVVTPFALWLAVDNAVGTWRWREARAALVARGEPLTMAQVLPPSLPDDDNYAMTPLLRPVLEYSLEVTNGRTEILWRDPVGRRRPEAIGFPPEVRPEGYSPRTATNDSRLSLDAYARGIRARPLRQVDFDLPEELARRYGVVRTNTPSLSQDEARALVIADPAREVLDYLRRFEPELDEIAAASRRRSSHFPVRWDEDGFSALLPQLAHAKRFSTLFRVRAAARLQSGDPAGAFADTKVTLQLAEKAASDPILIALLVRIAQSAIAAQAVWEGLAARQWTDAQVAELQSMQLAVDLGPEGVRAFRGERAVGNGFYDRLLSSASEIPESMAPSLPEGDPGAGGVGIGAGAYPRIFAPRGLLRRNQVYQNRLMDVLIARFQAPDWTVAATRELDEAAVRRLAGLEPVSPHNVLAWMLSPALVKAEAKLARQQTVARMVGVACALERHRLARGTFPEKLASLAPGLLAEVPSDPMSGKPFGYRRLENGWHALWSVGLNGRDDGGVMKDRDNDAQGDWVLPVPVPGTGPRLW